MIIITVDFHKALPVIVTLMILTMMISIPFEAHFFDESDIFEVFCDFSLACEEESSPFLETPLSQIHTWLLVEVWSSDHLTREIPCPLVERAGDGSSISLSTIHDRLTVATDIGYELDSLTCPHEHPTIVFMLQRRVISDIRYCPSMSYIAWTSTKEELELSLENIIIEVCSRWKHVFSWKMNNSKRIVSEK
jgi:hypothetical protein